MHYCYVIIPTHAQRPALKQALRALSQQTIPDNWCMQLILSHDGPATSTLEDLPSFSPRWQPAQILAGPKAGVAAARNRALKAIATKAPTSTHILLFLGDDIILRPHALAAHLLFHQQHPQITAGALGFINWDPYVKPSPLMDWMVHGGPQNNFDELLPGKAVDPSHFFYGSFVSVKYSLIKDITFPPYAQYGWEDLDFGRQIAQKRGRLYPLSQSQAIHSHFYTAQDIITRSRTIGASLVDYQQRHPAAALNIPTKRTQFRAWAYKYTGIGYIARLFFIVLSSHYTLPRLFLLVTAAEQWLGYFHTTQWKTKNDKNN